MVLHQAGVCLAIQLRKDKNNTPSLHPAAPREISHVAFLTSPGCGRGFDLEYLRANENHRAAKPRSELIYQEGDVTDHSCAMFTKENGRRRKKLGFCPMRPSHFHQKLNGLRHISFWTNNVLLRLDVIKLHSYGGAPLARL